MSNFPDVYTRVQEASVLLTALISSLDENKLYINPLIIDANTSLKKFLSFSAISSKVDEDPSVYLPLGYRNNNPLNIRYNSKNKWVGLRGHDDKGFCIFFSMVEGYRAGLRLLCNYIKRGYNTPEKIISRWAPSSENNTDVYLKFVCDHTRISSNTTITKFFQVRNIAFHMSAFELGVSKLCNEQYRYLKESLSIASVKYSYPLK